MGVLAQNPLKVEYYQDVSLPLEYATQVLDKKSHWIDINTANCKRSFVIEAFALPSFALTLLIILKP